MGANARRRAALKLVKRPPAKPRVDCKTKTRLRLERKMREVQTYQQFEEMVARAHPDHRGSIRKLLTEMLPDNLPCCGPAKLAAAIERLGKTVDPWEHTRLCPSRNRVQLVSL